MNSSICKYIKKTKNKYDKKGTISLREGEEKARRFRFPDLTLRANKSLILYDQKEWIFM